MMRTEEFLTNEGSNGSRNNIAEVTGEKKWVPHARMHREKLIERDHDFVASMVCESVPSVLLLELEAEPASYRTEKSAMGCQVTGLSPTFR
jgi:hypothetical protein